MLYIDPNHCIDCDACRVECPVEAILPEEDLTDDQQVFLEINTELSQIWPVITVKKDAPPDADEWVGKPNKLDLLVR